MRGGGETVLLACDVDRGWRHGSAGGAHTNFAVSRAGEMQKARGGPAWT